MLYFGFDAVAPRRRFSRKRGFPSREAYDEATVTAGRHIVAALADAGLDVRWNGTASARPVLVDVD